MNTQGSKIYVVAVTETKEFLTVHTSKEFAENMINRLVDCFCWDKDEMFIDEKYLDDFTVFDFLDAA